MGNDLRVETVGEGISCAHVVDEIRGTTCRREAIISLDGKGFCTFHEPEMRELVFEKLSDFERRLKALEEGS